MDPEGRQPKAHGIAQCFQCELLSRVQAIGRGDEFAGYRPKVDNPPGVLLPHLRGNRADHAHHSEYIDIEYPARLLIRNFLNRTNESIAGVVDQDINPAKLLKRAIDCLVDRFGLTDDLTARQLNRNSRLLSDKSG